MAYMYMYYVHSGVHLENFSRGGGAIVTYCEKLGGAMDYLGENYRG